MTANDVVNAIIAAVVRRWLRDRGELPKQSLVAICPIKDRDRDYPAVKNQHGNMFGLWLCPLGTNLDDPVARLALIHRSIAEGKQWVAKSGSAASLLATAGSIAATVIFPMLPFTQKIPHRIQPADFARSRTSGRNVLERRAYQGDVSGVTGL